MQEPAVRDHSHEGAKQALPPADQGREPGGKRRVEVGGDGVGGAGGVTQVVRGRRWCRGVFIEKEFDNFTKMCYSY